MMSEQTVPLQVPAKQQNSVPSVGIYIVVTFMLAVVVIAVARLQYQKGPELESAQRSALAASLCAIPILWMMLREPRSFVERFFIGIWWPLKIGITFYYYFVVWDAANQPAIYLQYSDHLPWHELAGRVATYWNQHGLGLISKDLLIRMSLNYPAAGYFFGIIYYCFGHYLSTALPWLSLVILVSSALGQKLMEQCGLPFKEARVALHLLLWSPFIWLLTLLVHRDPLVIFCWLAIAYSTLRAFQRFSLFNFIGLCAATVVLVNLRAEYLYVVMAWLMIVGAFSLRKRQNNQIFARIALLGASVIFLIFIGLSIWGADNYWYVSKYDIGVNVNNQIDTYRQMGGKGTGFYGKVLSFGGGILLPFILPFKFLVGLTAPFPWRFSTFQLSVTQPFYSAESILRLTLVYFSFFSIWRLRSVAKEWNIEVKLLLILGILVMVSGLMGPTSEVRYIAPAIPLLTPLFSASANRPLSWIVGLTFAISSIACLHLAYALFRGGF
jgi:hypothetical protein